MSLFQCYECGCRENTATSNFWTRQEGPWRGLPSQPWMLCSACDPEIGKWHGRFERKYLGNLCINPQRMCLHMRAGCGSIPAYAAN